MASVTLATVKRVAPVGLTGQNANQCNALFLKVIEFPNEN